MKEIGGYFGLEQLISNEYYKDLIALNNGRNALLYLLQSKKVKKLYIPLLLCNSISDMLKKNNYSFEYYNVDSKFLPIFNENISDGEYLYIVNYYGQLTNDLVHSYKKKFGRIILDNTQAFFQKPLEEIDTLYSCRKFFGVPDGAYLSTNTRISKDLEVDISRERMKHILGRYEGVASDYHNTFQENDASYKNESLKYMSNLTHNILGAINYEKVRAVRNENFAYLKSRLDDKNKLKVLVTDGAFSYPLYIENGIEIRKSLSKKKIYIPTLWPNVLKEAPKTSIEYEFAANILPLPCDQRYNIEDMERIVNYIDGGLI